MKKQFHIHHATKPGLRFTETINQPREYVGFVEASNLEEAFKKSQTDFNSEWDNRSTSVGDIIQDDDKFFMVKGRGFEELN